MIFISILSQWFYNLTYRQAAWTFWQNREQARVVRLPHGDLWMPAEQASELRPLIERILRESAKQGPSRDLRLLTFPSGSLFNFLLGIPSPIPFDVLRPGELRNNDPQRVKLVLDALEQEKPLFLIRVKEGSNRELSREIHRRAQRDYERVRSKRLDVYFRR